MDSTLLSVTTSTEPTETRQEWQRIHSFRDGWGWRRDHSAVVYAHECPYFGTLSQVAQDVTYAAIALRRLETRPRNGERYVAEFSQLHMPKIVVPLPKLLTITTLVD